jgi:hypothetical protein
MQMKLVGGLCCVGVLAGTASAQFQTIDDFNDGNFDGWSLVDPTGAGAADASSGALRLLSLAPLPPALGFGAVLDASTGDPSYSNGVYRTTVTLGNEFNTGGIGARFSLNQGLNFYYAFLGHDALGGGLALASVSGGGASLLDGILLPDLDLGETWNLEFGLQGDQMTLSAWQVGEPYPGTLIHHADAGFPLGAVGVVGGVSLIAPGDATVDVSFDDFQYAVPAPASGLALLLGLGARRPRRLTGLPAAH